MDQTRITSKVPSECKSNSTSGYSEAVVVEEMKLSPKVEKTKRSFKKSTFAKR